MMDIHFKQTELFGGAIVVDLPDTFRDVRYDSSVAVFCVLLHLS